MAGDILAAVAGGRLPPLALAGNSPPEDIFTEKNAGSGRGRAG
jgi:hypothetical protein